MGVINLLQNKNSFIFGVYITNINVVIIHFQLSIFFFNGFITAFPIYKYLLYISCTHSLKFFLNFIFHHAFINDLANNCKPQQIKAVLLVRR